MLDVDDAGRFYIVCDVREGDSFCSSKIVLSFSESDLKESKSGIPSFEELTKQAAQHREILDSCYKQAFWKGWSEFIYPGDGSIVGGKRTYFGTNDLCPHHKGFIPEDIEI